MSQRSQARTPTPAPSRLPAFALLMMLALAPALCVPASTLVGQPAPDFALRSAQGDNVRLSEHSGEVVLINFWATWCGPCRQEMPLLDEIYGKYRRAGLVLFSVNIDEPGNLEAAREMAKTLRVSYPVLFDERKDVSRAYQTSTMPLTVLIDRAGIVRDVFERLTTAWSIAEPPRRLWQNRLRVPATDPERASAGRPGGQRRPAQRGAPPAAVGAGRCGRSHWTQRDGGAAEQHCQTDAERCGSHARYCRGFPSLLRAS